MKKILLLLLLPLVSKNIIGQIKQQENIGQVWTGYFNQTRFTGHWGIWAETQLRTKEDYFNNFSQALVRIGLTYYLTDEAKLTAGYAFINFFPGDNHKNISQPEHRPWQQLQWHTKYKKLRLMQWIRLEERYRRKIRNNDELAEGYNFNFRARYNLFSLFPLSKKRFQPGTLSFVVNDEILVNFGKEIIYNYFDQNRFFVGLNYHVNKHDNLQFGYMNIFQQLSSGYKYRSTDVARIFYFHNIDLRKHSN